MAKKILYPQAVMLAGRIYGLCLDRNSDSEGFDYCVEMLTNGTCSVRELVTQMCQSEEFREKYLMNETPNGFYPQMARRFLDLSETAPEDIKKWAIMILEQDWRTVVQAFFESEAYLSLYGDNKLP